MNLPPAKFMIFLVFLAPAAHFKINWKNTEFADAKTRRSQRKSIFNRLKVWYFCCFLAHGRRKICVEYVVTRNRILRILDECDWPPPYFELDLVGRGGSMTLIYPDPMLPVLSWLLWVEAPRVYIPNATLFGNPIDLKQKSQISDSGAGSSRF